MEVDYLKLLQDDGMFGLLRLGLVNGILVGSITGAFHWYIRCQCRSKNTKPQAPQSTDLHGIGVGFFCGLMSIFIMISPTGLLLLTAFIMLLVGYNLKIFAHDMVYMLTPGKHATWDEVGQLLRVWLTIIAAFTMINTSLEIWHRLFHPGQIAFGFQGRGEMLLDAFYFSTVVMTTLGFGDIAPHTPGAKALVVIECLIGYVMFALMVGIVTRGVTAPNSDAGERKKDTL